MAQHPHQPQGISLVPARPAYRWSPPIPQPLTSLVGREAEMERLVAAIRHPHTRLITLTGTGGVGKTRLAMAGAIATASDFADGAVFVRLAPVHHASLVPEVIAAALHLPAIPHQFWLDTLAMHLARTQALLILDNMEHLLDFAPDLVTLLQHAPNLRVLITSRAVLRVNGETVFRVMPLATSLPEDGALHDSTPPHLAPATRLFLERAQAQDHTLTVTQDLVTTANAICHQLDGLPLAIELAASRLTTLSPVELLSRMQSRTQDPETSHRDAPERFQSLERTIAWSYDLLAADEQRLLHALAMFPGGATLAALETMSHLLGYQASGVTDHLTSLIEHSLVDHLDPPKGTERRYWMLETIRSFVLERVTATDSSQQLQRAHAVWLARMLEARERAILLGSPHHVRQVADIRLELANVHAALTWCLAWKETELALRIVAAHGVQWTLIDRYREGVDWTTRALALPGQEEISADIRLRTWGVLVMLRALLGEFAEAAVGSGEVRVLQTEVDDADAFGFGFQVQAYAAVYQGDADLADSMGMRAYHQYLQDGTPEYAYMGLHPAAMGALQAGRLDLAESRFQEMMRIAERQQHPWLTCGALIGLIHVARQQGDMKWARSLLTQALPLVAEHMEAWTALSHLEHLAALDVATAPERAVVLLGATSTLRNLVVSPIAHVEQAALTVTLDQARSLLSNSTFSAAWARGASLTLEEAVAIALAAEPEPTTPSGAEDDGPRLLTDREMDVLRLLAEGLADKEIAEAIGGSRKTASRLVGAILARLEVQSRTAAAIKAHRLGLLDSPE